MAAALDHLVNHVRSLVAAEGGSQGTDGQLLQRFAANRDEVAFATLVYRHGPMVLSVCRRVLQNDTDAEDACQATFLILARKARSIRKKDSVASWLHGVAQRTASTLRRQLGRRRKREKAAAPMSEPDPVVEITWREVQTVLDEEIARLPEKFKGPILLWFFEGMAHIEGAQQLGCSLTTFRGRLERGCELLRRALSRRGITLSGALLAAVLAHKTATAAMPPYLMLATVRAALASESAVPGVVSTPISILAQGVMQAMVPSKLKLGVAAVLFVTTAFGISGFALSGLAGGGTSNEEPPGAIVNDQDLVGTGGKPKDAAKENGPADGNAKFKARLPDGAAIELVGVGQHPAEGKAWWLADGTPLPDRVDDTSALKEPQQGGHFLRELAIHVRKNATATVDVMSQASIGGLTTTSGTDESLRIRQSLSIPRDTEEMTVKVGYANGAWLVAAEADTKGNSKSMDVRFSAIERTPDGRAQVRIEHGLRDDQRQIVAYDTAGKRHISFPNSRQHTGTVLKDEGQFSLAVEDIQRIVLEVRRYTWVEVRHVSLHAGKKTKVEVVIDPTPKPRDDVVDPEVLAKLTAQLRSKDHETRSAAVAALGKLLLANRDTKTDWSRLVEPLFALAGWGGIASKDARAAEDLIVRIGAQATPLLRQRLTSADAHDRRVAVELLVRIGPRERPLATLLRPLLEDQDHYVRKAAIDALGMIGGPADAAVADLERVANNDPMLPRRVAARLALIRIAGASPERVRALAAFLVMQEPCDGAAVYAAATLGDLGAKAKAAEPQLLAALKHEESGVRAAAAHALGQIGANSPDTVMALVDLLSNDPHLGVRRSTAAALGEIGPAAKAAIPALRAALKSDAQKGWWVAADALGKIGGAEAVPGLTEALTNPDEDIRRTAMKALGELGVVARTALAALEKARLEEPRDFNRAAAAAALRKIEQAVKDAAKNSNTEEPLTDPGEAIEALEKMHVRLDRDKTGLVVHARLPVKAAPLDAAIPHLRRLPRLAWLALDEFSLSTAGFRQLDAFRSLNELELHANEKCPPMPWQDLRNVRCVRLSGEGVDDTLLKAVSGMPAVTSLHLNRVAVTADGLAHLQRMSKLDMVLIQSSNATAEGVERLGQIAKLRSLTLCGNDIGHTGFDHLGKLMRLEYLNLESTGCTDDDVKVLKSLANLSDLDLGYNQGVTDAGLRHLADLKKLAGLRLYETKVTDGGVAELKKALPKLSVGK